MKNNLLRKFYYIAVFLVLSGFLYIPLSPFSNIEFANAGTRVKTVQFFGGQDAGSATNDNSATAQNFTQQNVEIAEGTVDIIDAYVELSLQHGANAATTSTEAMIYFDACNPTACTPTPAIIMNTAGLGTNSGEAQTLRFRADVSAEATLAAFTGGTFAFQIGYCIDGATGTDAGTCNGTAAASIQGANAKLVVSYTYDDTSATQTNTVIYPLESNTTGPVGSKTAVQATCTMDSNCPKFSYNANIPEISSQVSQFFHTQASAGAGAASTTTDYAFIPQVDGNASGSTIYFEQALLSNGGWMNQLVSGLAGYANNSAQQLETGVNGNTWVLGGENYVTYKYAQSAGTKTKTIVMPVGEVQTVGSTTKSALTGSTVYFPETGVNVEKAWFRVHTTAGGQTTAVNLDITTKVGGNAESGITSYAFTSATQGVSDDGYFIHMIPSTDYTELEAATADAGKLVQMSADWATARGAVSAELVITYTYTSDTDGFNQTQTLFAGQSTAAAATTFSAASGEVDPYIYTGTGTKTILGVSVLMNGKDTGAVANQTTGINMTVSGNACTATNTSTTLTDTEITRIAMFKSITGIVTNNNATTYTPCYSSSEASIFNGRVSITVMVDLRTTDISGTTSLADASSVIKVAVNGVLDSATGSIVSGAWTITPATAPTTGQSIIVFINTGGAGDSGEATSITKYDGTGDITGMELNAGILTIGSADNQSITLANIDDYTCTTDEDVMHSVISSVLNIEGQSCAGAVNNSYSGETIKVLSGNTLTIGSTETLTTEKINNAGTITSTTTATYNLAGISGTLFTNTGTFTEATSTVNVTSPSGTPTLLSATETFHILNINSAATVINAGAVINIADASGSKLYVQSGVLNDSGVGITTSGSTNNTLQLGSGATLCLGGSAGANTSNLCSTNGSSTSAISMPGFATYNFATDSTVLFMSDADITISSTPTYGLLSLRPILVNTNRTYTFGGTMNIAYNLSINPQELNSGTPILSVNAGGNINVTGGTKDIVIMGSYSATSKLVLKPAGVSYNITTGYISVRDGGTLDGSTNTATSTINLTGASGTLFTLVGTGVFNAGNTTVNVTNQDDQLSWIAASGLPSNDWYPQGSVSANGAKMIVQSAQGNGIYYSTNYGVSFTQSNQTSGAFGDAWMVSDGVNARITKSGVVYGSSDGGATWSSVGGSITGGNAIATSDDLTKLAAISWGTANKIKYSTDSGATLLDSNSTSTSNWNHIASSNDGIFLASMSNTNQLYTSTDGGINWTARDSNRNWKGVTVSGDGTKMWAVAYGGDIYYSSDSGATWNPKSAGTANWFSIATSTDGQRVAATIYGQGGANSLIKTSDDAGTTWSQQTEDLTVSVNGSTGRRFNGMAMSAGGLILANTSYASNETVYVSEPVTLASGTPSFYNLTLASGAYHNRLGEALTVTNDLTITGGDLDTNAASNYAISAKTVTINGGVLSANASTISITGTTGTLFTNSSGYFDRGTSTVNLTGNGTATVNSGTPTFYNLTNSGTGTKTLGGNITVANVLTVSAGTFAQGAYNLTLSGTGTPLSVSGTFDGGTGTTYYTGDGAVTVAVAPYYNLQLTPTITAGRTYTLNATNITNNFTINPTAASSLALTVNMGADLSVGGATSVTGTTSGTSLLDFDTGTDRNITTASITVGAAGTLDLTSSASIITLTGTGSVFDMNASGTINAGSSIIKLSDNSATAKTFNGGGKTYYDLWLNSAAGTSTGQFTINGSNTFNTFTDLGTGAHTIVFAANSTTTVTAFTIESATTSIITMQSSNTGVDKWYIVDTGGANQVRYVNIKDSDASGGADWDAYTYSADNTNGGNNTVGAPSWVFALPVSISGTTDLADASNVIKVAVNGALDSASGSITSGTWTITLASGITSGQVLVVYVDGSVDRYESTNVSKYDGTGNLSGLVLNAKVLTIGSADNQSISLTNLDTYDCSADEDVMYSVTASVLNTEGQGCAGSVNNSYTGDSLSILSSNTLTIATSETVTTEYINNAGTITASGSPTINVDGTSSTLFTNSGTFTAGSSTVNLRGNGDATINSGSPTFYNLTNSGTGTKTLGAGITIGSGGTFAVNAGVFDPAGYTVTGSGSNTFTVDSGATIKVDAGTLPGNYNFSSYTLNADSTTNYSAAGAQTISGTPTYGNLTITGSGTKTLGAATTAAGTVTATAGTLDTDAGNSYTLTAPRIVINGGTVNLNASSLYLNATSGTLFTISSGVFNAGTSLVRSTGNGDTTINSGSPTFNAFQNTGTGIKTLGANLNIDSGNLIVYEGTINPGSYAFNFTNGADITACTSTFLVTATTFGGSYNGVGSYALCGGDPTLEYSRSGAQTVINPSNFFGVVNTSGSGDKTLGSSFTTGSVTIGSGTTLLLDTYTLTLSNFGTPLTATGTFTANTGTVKFIADSTVNIPAVSYYNLNLEPTITGTQEYNLNATTVTNNLTINPTAASALALIVNMGANLVVTGTTSITGTTSGTSTLDMDTGNSYNLTTGNLNIASAGTLDATSATSTITLNGTSGTLFTNAGTFTPGSSTIVASSDAAVTLFSTGFTINNLTLSPTITANRTYTMGGVMTLNGTLSMTPTASSAYVLTVDTTGTSLTAYSSDTVIDGAGSANVSWAAYSNTHMRKLSVGTGDTIAFGGSYVGIYATSGTGVTNNGTITGGTFHFLGDGSITLTSGTMTLGGIVLDPTLTINRVYTFGIGLTVTNDFTIEPAGSGELTVNLRDVTVGGVTTVSKSGNATSILDAVSGSDYDLTTTSINIATGGTFLGQGSTINLTGTSGTLFTETGTFTAGASTVIMSGASGTPTVASGTPTFNNLTISGAATKSLGEALTVVGDLTISAGTLQLSTLGLEVHGSTSITGTLNDNSATGTNLFIGAVTINSGGVWATSNNPAFEFKSNFTNNSSSGFTSGTGTYSFTEVAISQELSGTQAFTITNVSNSNQVNGLVLSGQYPTIGTLTQQTSGRLKFTGTLPTITTLDATANPNTVQYAGATQNIKDTTYHHLIVGDSSIGTKTLTGNITVNGDLTVNTDSVLDPTSSYSVNTSGTNDLTVYGTIKVQHSTFTGSYNGFDTFSLSSGTTDYALSGAQTVDNTNAYGTLKLSGSGTKTLAGDVNTANALVTGTAIVDPLTYSLSDFVGGNSLNVESGATLLVKAGAFSGGGGAGNYQHSTVNLNSGSIVDYASAGAQTISNSLSYSNLKTSGSGVKTLGGNTTITGDMTVGTGTTIDPTASYTLTGSGTNTLDVTGIIRAQHSTFAGSYPSFETKTLNTGSVVDYYLNGAQTIDNTLSYAGLAISSGGTKTLGGATTATGTTTVAGGTLDVGSGSNYTLNTGALSLTGGTFLPRSATVNLTGTGTVFSYSSGTYTRDAETINLTDSSGSSKTFAGGGRSFNTVVFAGNGAGEFIISGDNTFNKFKVLNPPHTLLFTAGSTQTVKEWDVLGTPGNLVTLNSTSNGTDWNLYLAPTNYGYGTYSSEYLSIRDSAASGNSYFNAIYAGYSSVDDTTGGSTNTGWIFQIRSQGGGGGAVEASASVGTCADGQQNGDETGTDTGGRCVGGGGVGSGTGTCIDGIQNEDETGVDTGGRCALGTCADGIQNGNETGVDTGGRCVGGGGSGDAGGDVGYIFKNNRFLLASAGAINIPLNLRSILGFVFFKFII